MPIPPWEMGTTWMDDGRRPEKIVLLHRHLMASALHPYDKLILSNIFFYFFFLLIPTIKSNLLIQSPPPFFFDTPPDSPWIN